MTDREQLLFELIQQRRTISSFRPELPPREVIVRAIEAAIWAPNHRHTSPWRFTLLEPATVRSVIALNTRLITAKKGAEAAAAKEKSWSAVPGWLLVTSLQSADPVQAEEDYAACCCAVQNLSLDLWSVGVGVKWSTGDVTRHAEFLPLIGINPAEERLVGLFWYGYPAVIPQQTRPPVEQFIRTR